MGNQPVYFRHRASIPKRAAMAFSATVRYTVFETPLRDDCGDDAPVRARSRVRSV